ncbi:phosphatidylglycerophosphatase A [Acidobacteriia bacterium AH_259_A11_L15]|nr:phosphatidylglycerophosphatase A [Acidobacteriia bacterium AH_259_A11_L15]
MGLGLGYFPVWPGTVGSLASVLAFALLFHFLEGVLLRFTYLVVLLALVLVAFWSTEHALRRWQTEDPQVVVIDEVAGQWLAYGALVLPGIEYPAGAGWKYLLAGFILFRALDTMKPFPIRRSEHLPGATGVVVDDLIAAVYSGLALLGLNWTGWLR